MNNKTQIPAEDIFAINQRYKDALSDMTRSVNLLALQLPDTVWDDVNKKFHELAEAAHYLISTQHPQQTDTELVREIGAILEIWKDNGSHHVQGISLKDVLVKCKAALTGKGGGV